MEGPAPAAQEAWRVWERPGRHSVCRVAATVEAHAAPTGSGSPGRLPRSQGGSDLNLRADSLQIQKVLMVLVIRRWDLAPCAASKLSWPNCPPQGPPWGQECWCLGGHSTPRLG